MVRADAAASSAEVCVEFPEDMVGSDRVVGAVANGERHTLGRVAPDVAGGEDARQVVPTTQGSRSASGHDFDRAGMATVRMKPFASTATLGGSKSVRCALPPMNTNKAGHSRTCVSAISVVADAHPGQRAVALHRVDFDVAEDLDLGMPLDPLREIVRHALTKVAATQ